MNSNLAKLKELTDKLDLKNEDLILKAALYERIVSIIGEGIWVIDRNGIVIFCNEKLAEILNVKQDDIVGKSIWDFIPDDQFAQAVLNLAKRQSGQGETYIFRLKRAFSPNILVRITATPLFNEENEYEGVVALISENGKLSEFQKNTFFELSMDLMCIAGFDGIFREVNETFVKELGYSKEEFLTKPFIDFVVAEDKEKTIQATYNLVVANEDVVEFSNRYIAKNGDIKKIVWRARAHKEYQLIFATARIER